MRPILCVIDLSQSSAKVLEVAARMAHAYKSQLTILFPYRLINSGYSVEIAKLKAQLEHEARERFDTIRQQVPLLQHINFDFQPEIGFTADRVGSFLRRNKADAIVMGEQQANQMNEVNQLTLQTLITTSKVPFTIVPEEVDEEVPSH